MSDHHPIFGHTITNQRLGHHQHPLALHGPIVHIKSVIKTVEEDVRVQGVAHHHLLIHQTAVFDVRGGDPSIVKDEIFCSIRYGDSWGLNGPIPDLQAGQVIELQGEYIDKNHAYPSVGNPGDPVLHFTHHPVGFVIYQGVRYE
ncbi:hypothetical protein [Effusibacillus pohliae]|uniref:hypothetical protein n=1 Tax=Effusibacillus pohliae TaxID=232270 RepID=UPI00036CA241|nr:hypothetical protein [Effusibacillus pohliae]